jgi:hypothetical protein
VAVVGALLTGRVGYELATRIPGADISHLSLTSLVGIGADSGSTALAAQMRDAFAAGAPGAFWALLPLQALSLCAMFLIPHRDLRRTVHEVGEVREPAVRSAPPAAPRGAPVPRPVSR